jgi:hypothetical protein
MRIRVFYGDWPRLRLPRDDGWDGYSYDDAGLYPEPGDLVEVPATVVHRLQGHAGEPQLATVYAVDPPGHLVYHGPVSRIVRIVKRRSRGSRANAVRLAEQAERGADQAAEFRQAADLLDACHPAAAQLLRAQANALDE